MPLRFDDACLRPGYLEGPLVWQKPEQGQDIALYSIRAVTAENRKILPLLYEIYAGPDSAWLMSSTVRPWRDPGVTLSP